MFINRVTSYAFMAHCILQILFKSGFFFPKSCSVLVSILIWIMFHWRRYQAYVFICPLPHREPSLFSAEQEVPQCTHSPLGSESATGVFPPKSFGKAQRQLIAGESSCPAGLPGLPTAPAIATAHVGRADSPPGTAIRTEQRSHLALSKWVLTLTAY